MSKHSKLIEQAGLFEKLAYDAHALTNVVANHKAAIAAEIAGGIQAVNHLFTTNRDSAKSLGLQHLDDAFGRMGAYVSALKAEYLDQTLPSIKELVSQALFYTSKSNAGTGYDPWTRVGESHSPAAYVDRIAAHVKNLEAAANKNAPKPQTPAQNLPPAPTAAQA